MVTYQWIGTNIHTYLNVYDLEQICHTYLNVYDLKIVFRRDILHVCPQNAWIQESGWKSLTWRRKNCKQQEV